MTKWTFLPELPPVQKEVLVAIKYGETPIQAYWDGKSWVGSFDVRDNMNDGFVGDPSLGSMSKYVYAWTELPEVPKVPETD